MMFWSRLFGILAAVGVVGSAAAQVDFGPETYPHFRGMSGLSGGGFGVLPNGTPSMQGAMAISTPIAFSLRGWHGAIGGSSLSYNSSFTGLNILPRSNSFRSSGVADGMIGYGGDWGALTLSYEFVSSLLDHVESLQYQLPLKSDRYGVSVGCQDLQNHGGAQGEGVDATGFSSASRSVFVVGTAEVASGLYVSLGKGDIRFKKGLFGNASYNVTPRAKLVGEYDTFGWNYCVAYGLGRFPGFSPWGHSVEPVLSAGFTAGSRALAMVNFTF